MKLDVTLEEAKTTVVALTLLDQLLDQILAGDIDVPISVRMGSCDILLIRQQTKSVIMALIEAMKKDILDARKNDG